MADTEYAEVFREEAGELLEELETSLLELEKDPADLKIVSRVFRAMHTIKGSGAMFGFDDIAGFTHHVETALDKVRDGTVPVSTELIDLTLASRDLSASCSMPPPAEARQIPPRGSGSFPGCKPWLAAAPRIGHRRLLLRRSRQRKRIPPRAGAVITGFPLSRRRSFLSAATPWKR